MSAYLQLFRLKIALMVSASAAMGYVLAAGKGSAAPWLSLAGVFFLSSGASVLNQIQERALDARMERTRLRPLPAGRISAAGAWTAAVVLIGLGLTILGFASFWATVCGVAALVWYNGVYTHLKRSTPFAAVPGALVGALPPVIGWILGGGGAFDRQIGAIALFFFIWQVPHFWLFLVNNGPDYERAGLPALTSTFSRAQLKRITFIWMLATAVCCLLLPLFGSADSTAVRLGLICAGGRLIWTGAAMLRREALYLMAPLSFKEINRYAMVVMALIALDTLF